MEIPLKDNPQGPSSQEQDFIRTIAEPFHDYTDEKLRDFARNFLRKANLGDELVATFENGAYLAQQPERFQDLHLTNDESTALAKERENKWNISRTLILLVIVCSMSAAVQGMDESVVNAAQIFYKNDSKIIYRAFGKDTFLGLLNAAPYISCASVGCWLTEPMNKRFGRRGTIFITCIISSISCLWQGLANCWWNLFIARLVLGLGIGPKSATVPIYAAESSPAVIRGALTMMWQMWVAFGIMLGFLAGVAFSSKRINTDLKWRLMIASPMVLPLIVCSCVFFCPESPRWLIDKNRFQEAFQALESLRGTKLQAARDLLHIYASLEAEKRIRQEKGTFQRWKELVTVPRNFRALRASTIVMALQQLGGVNIIVYYSTQILTKNGISTYNALLISMGFGIVNFLFALPAVWAIDTIGRRSLLLITFPMMSIFLLFTGFYLNAFNKKATTTSHRNITMEAPVCAGMLLFAAAYSPGEGPVPFVYAAESFPLYLRDIGMSWSTSVTWFLNFVVAITLPVMLGHLGAMGTFGYYAAWNAVGFFLIFFFVPETKGKTLEGLDRVFRHSTARKRIAGIRDWLQGRRRGRRGSSRRLPEDRSIIEAPYIK